MKDIFLLLCLIIVLLLSVKNNDNKIPYFINKNISELEDYCEKNNFILEIEMEYSKEIPKDYIINQDINSNTIKVIVSLGNNKSELYNEYKVNELGMVPIMMYHGIQDVTDNNYIGGNIDKDGYHRTAIAFKKDLDFYYNNGYRMIRLNDYINGKIDVSLGNSPIIITFDDGLSNNIRVFGLDENGEIIIDPNSAVGILEEYKLKYPDYNVTATFFINDSLFNQLEYNDKILKWLINHGYDIGNHTSNHISLTNTTKEQTVKEIGSMYKKLESIIGNSYIPIVALPFGEPYSKNHNNFEYILDGNYNGYIYKTFATLRVGWESELSPFHKNFDKTYLKRIRAYDNDGTNFDIEHNFNLLSSNRYISDGDINTIVTTKSNEDKINPELQYILY